MSVSENVRERIFHLIDEGKEAAAAEAAEAKREYSATDNAVLYGACEGWITSALNAIEIVCPNQQSSYRTRASELATSKLDQYLNYQQVYSLVALLERLMEDIDAGLISSIESEVTAINYDQFLDHGEAYFKAGKKNEAAVIAGIVFEDTIRTLSRDNGIEDGGEKLDKLISELDKSGIITGLKAKRARAAAGLRTSASHARWDEFELSDVKPVVDFTRELILTHLAPD